MEEKLTNNEMEVMEGDITMNNVTNEDVELGNAEVYSEDEMSSSGILLGTVIGLGLSAVGSVAYKKMIKPGYIKMRDYIRNKKESHAAEETTIIYVD